MGDGNTIDTKRVFIVLFEEAIGNTYTLVFVFVCLLRCVVFIVLFDSWHTTGHTHTPNLAKCCTVNLAILIEIIFARFFYF